MLPTEGAAGASVRGVKKGQNDFLTSNRRVGMVDHRIVMTLLL